MKHISDHDLERYHLGMVVDEAELAEIEEHLLVCSPCIDAAEQAAPYVDTIRAAIISGHFDLETVRTGNNAATRVANRQHANFCRTKVFTTETKIITETKVVTEIKLNLPAH